MPGGAPGRDVFKIETTVKVSADVCMAGGEVIKRTMKGSFFSERMDGIGGIEQKAIDK